MKILFCILYNKNPIEFIGIESIMTYLEQYGYSSDIIMIDINKNIKDEILKIDIKYELIGFNIEYNNAEKSFEIFKILKNRKPNVKIFLGGPFATLAYREIMKSCKEVDFIILGDGEVVLKEYLDNIVNNNICESPYIYFQNDKHEKHAYRLSSNDFVRIQHKQFDLPEFKMMYMARLYASRGCCANCSFCTHNFHRNTTLPAWMGRTVKDVFGEMIEIYEKYGIRIFTFNDSSFEDPGKLGKQRIDELCNYLINYPVKFSINCSMRCESFSYEDKPLIEKMYRAGIKNIFFGIESLDDDELTFYNKRARADDIKRSLNLFSKFNVSYGLIMLGPLSSSISLRKNMDFLKSVQHCFSGLYELQLAVYYKSNMESQLSKLGLLTDKYNYLSPYEYIFRDENMKIIIERIKISHEMCNFYSKERDFKEFLDLYNGILNFNSDIVGESDINLFGELKHMLFDTLYNYYNNMFFNPHFDIYNDSVKFNETVNKVYDEYYHMKNKALRKKFVLSYLLK